MRSPKELIPFGFALAVGLGANAILKHQEILNAGAAKPIERPFGQIMDPVSASAETQRDFDVLLAYLTGQNRCPDPSGHERKIDPKDLVIVISPQAGKVVPENGLKVRDWPDKTGNELDPEDWLRYGEIVFYPFEVRMKSGDRWGVIEIPRGDESVYQLGFFASETKGKELVMAPQGTP